MEDDSISKFVAMLLFIISLFFPSNHKIDADFTRQKQQNRKSAPSIYLLKYLDPRHSKGVE